MKPLERIKGQIQVISGLDQINATGGKDGPGDHARACAHVPDRRPGQEDRRRRHPRGHLDRPGRGAADRPPHAVPLAGAGLRRRPQVRQLRLGLFVRLPVQPVLVVALAAAGPRAEPPLRLRAALRLGPVGPSATKNLLAPPGAAAVDPRFRPRRHPGLAGRAGLPRPAEARRVPDERARDRAAHPGGRAVPRHPQPGRGLPAGIPASFLEHVQLMYDLMFLAFQTDSTRIATFLLAYESSNRTFPDIGITDGHHNLSHHQNKKENLEKIAQIDLWYMTAVRPLPGTARGREGCRRDLDAPQLDDRLRQRQRRRQPPQPQQPAVPDGGPRRRQPVAGPVS